MIGISDSGPDPQEASDRLHFNCERADQEKISKECRKYS